MEKIRVSQNAVFSRPSLVQIVAIGSSPRQKLLKLVEIRQWTFKRLQVSQTPPKVRRRTHLGHG